MPLNDRPSSNIPEDANLSHQPEAYNVADVLKLVGIGRTKLYEEMASGRLRSFVLCGRRMILREDLRSWLIAARDRQE